MKRRAVNRLCVVGSVAVLLAIPIVCWLGHGVARGAFALTPGGRFVAVAAQRCAALVYLRRFDMGQFQMQPLIVQMGSAPHDFADYDVGFDAQHHPHHYAALGAQLVIASSHDYPGSRAYLFAKIPLWLLLLLALPAPALVARRALVSRRRAARGLCLACGYDLRGSISRCPECGTPMAAGSTSRCAV